MKTLDESAQEYAENIRPITGLDKFDAPFITAFEHNGDIEEAFKEGANWQASQGWISLKDEIPTREKYGDKVLLYRILNIDQYAMSYSIHETGRVKYCNPDETWFMKLPQPPNKINS